MVPNKQIDPLGILGDKAKKQADPLGILKKKEPSESALVEKLVLQKSHRDSQVLNQQKYSQLR
jgi:hypothetical protein